jgi:hypothetical protein
MKPQAIKVLGRYLGVDDAVAEKLMDALKTEFFFRRILMLPVGHGFRRSSLRGSQSQLHHVHNPTVAAKFIKDFNKKVRTAWAVAQVPRRKDPRHRTPPGQDGRLWVDLN